MQFFCLITTLVAGGIIEGDVRINGHPKVQETFSRISGYCEQTDVHSPQTNIVEALLFSARLRINGDIDKETLEAYVDEVMDLVELTSIQKTIVSLSHSTTIQRLASRKKKE